MVKNSNRNSDICPFFPYRNATHCSENWKMLIRVLVFKNRTTWKYNIYLGSAFYGGFSFQLLFNELAKCFFFFFLPGPQVMLLHVQYSPEYSRGTFCVYAEFSLPLCASLSSPVLSAMNARYFDLTPQLQFSTPIPYQTYLCHRV